MSSTGLQGFNFHGYEIRVVMIDGHEWFVAADVTAALGYRDGYDAVKKLPLDERRTYEINRFAAESVTSRRLQSMTIVNEPGLYRLVFGSTLASATRFKWWVFHLVLPAIRRTGNFGIETLLQHAEDQGRYMVNAETLLARLGRDFKGWYYGRHTAYHGKLFYDDDKQTMAGSGMSQTRYMLNVTQSGLVIASTRNFKGDDNIIAIKKGLFRFLWEEVLTPYMKQSIIDNRKNELSLQWKAELEADMASGIDIDA